jgi:hypothetical protein
MKKQIPLMVFGVLALGATGCGKAGAAAPGQDSGKLIVPDRPAELLLATAHYGPLSVREGDTDLVQADTRPWSSYWYPYANDLLVTASARNGGQATLDKYDKYSAAVFNKKSAAVAEEIRSGAYNPQAEKWEGHCGSWSIASVLEAEPALPTKGVTVGGVTFYTRDVKALMIKSYENIVDNKQFHYFGQSQDDDGVEDGQSIYPDQFHRVMQAELFDKHRPFIMNEDHEGQVWNTPVWEAESTISGDANDPHVMHVHTLAQGAQSDLVSPDYAGPSQDTTYEYFYDLYGTLQPDGSFLVAYGKWTGKSVKAHPGFVMAFPPKGTDVKHYTANKEIDAQVLSDIFARRARSTTPRAGFPEFGSAKTTHLR